MGTSSKYLTHRVLPNIDETGIVLEEYNNVNTFKSLRVNNTNTNTSNEGGMVTALEKT